MQFVWTWVIKSWTEPINSKDEGCYAKGNPSLCGLSNQVPHLSWAMFSPSPAIILSSRYNHLNNRTLAVLLVQGANPCVCRPHWLRGLRRGTAAAHLLGLRVRIPAGNGCLYLARVVCCPVEFSASGWSPVQRSPTECGLSECDQADKMLSLLSYTICILQIIRNT
jgi:hypothetical protein